MEFKSRMSTFYLSLCALFAALSAVLSQLAIPIGPVPINMVHISIFMAAGLLGAKYGTLSQAVFVLMGIVGIPVFANMGSGFGTLMGPTGGFIVGNLLCTLVAGLIIDRWGRSVKALVSAMCAGYVATYLFGVSWFMFWSNNLAAAPREEALTIVGALVLVMFPFLPGEILKVAISVVLIRKLFPIVQRRIYQ